MHNLHTIESAPETSVESLKAIAKNLGFIPNIFAVIAESPSALAGFLALNSHFADSGFSVEEQQIIQLATSTENSCVYCVSGHTAFCHQLEVPEETIDAMRNEQTLSNSRLNALSQFTKILIREKGQITGKDIRAFYTAGYTEAQFFELAMGVCVKYFSNLVSNALTIPLDSAFEAYTWKRSQ